jgi:large subunit ribosomal protein L18
MKLTKKERLKKRHYRVRRKVEGSMERPRLCIRKTLKHLYAQVIDDSSPGGSRTLATFTTASKDNRGKHMCNQKQAAELGKVVGGELKAQGIESIVFDRSGYRYHGCVKALADGVREQGIQF